MIAYGQRMVRRFRGSITPVIVALLVATTLAVANTAPAQAQVELQSQRADLDTAARALIDDVYQDFLGRSATSADFERFEPRFGLGQDANDVRARVIGSREFHSDVANSSRRGFVEAAYRETLGRAPTPGELDRGARELFTGQGPLRQRRIDFAEVLLERADYDNDNLGVRELVLHETDSGMIRRFAFELDSNLDRNDAMAISVSIGGRQLSGQMTVRAFENIVSFIPDEPVERAGKIVGLVAVDNGNKVTLADISALSNFLPPRSEASIWPDRVFEDQRIIAYYGNHVTPLLGVLGETGPEAAVQRVNNAAAPFDAPDKAAVGAFEMIVTVAQGSAGADGNFSSPSQLSDVAEWIQIAEDAGLYVILDIQPGRSDFLTESRVYEELLKRPNVGLALDPEWRMGPNQRPGQVVGSVSAAEVNQVSAWLSNLVLENDLPEKIFMIHQFQTRMVRNREDLVDRPGLATVIHADGFGSRSLKLVTYRNVGVEPPFYNGFKLFIDEDTRIFAPADLLALTDHPVPDFVSYQ